MVITPLGDGWVAIHPKNAVKNDKITFRRNADETTDQILPFSIVCAFVAEEIRRERMTNVALASIQELLPDIG